GLGWRQAIGPDSSTLGLSRAHRLAVGPPFEAETDRALHALAEIFIHADQALARPCAVLFIAGLLRPLGDDALPVPAAFPILRHDGTQGRIGLDGTKLRRPALFRRAVSRSLARRRQMRDFRPESVLFRSAPRT